MVENIEQFSKQAEELRSTSVSSIQLSIGHELVADALGLVPGKTYTDRCASIASGKNNIEKAMQLAKKLAEISRKNFNGKLVYQAGVWEGIDFDRLDVDIIGSDAFFDKYWSESTVKSMIRSYKSSKKLVYITEFGSATFKGAKVTGSDAWRFSGSYDENEQLESNENYLKIWSELQVDGCFLYTFYEPIQPWRTEAQSFGIVRDAKGKSRLSRKKAYWLYKSYKHS